MNRCARQDNIEFAQKPDWSKGIQSNGEPNLFSLEIICRECKSTVTVTKVTGKQCHSWLNIARIKHDTCHVGNLVNAENRS